MGIIISRAVGLHILMHELGLARSIAGIAEENAKGRNLKAVRVAIGPLACIERGALEKVGSSH